MTQCPHCGWPDTAQNQVVSRHLTHDGQTVWIRCGGCGSLQVRVVDDGCARTVARGRPAA
jgi:uncharacterized Zn finger protein